MGVTDRTALIREMWRERKAKPGPPAAAELPLLTSRQRRVYRYMLDYQREHGMPPTVREIAAALDIASPNGAMCHIKALVAKGYVKRVGDGFRRAAFAAVDLRSPRCRRCGQPLPPDAERA